MGDIQKTGEGGARPSTIVEAVTPKSISYPDDRHLHIVTDEELENLKSATHQGQAGLALAAFGTCLASAPGAWPALGALSGQLPIAPEAARWLAVFLVTFVLMIVCGYNGWRKKDAVDHLVENIRHRKQLPLVPIDGADIIANGEVAPDTSTVSPSRP